MYTDEEIKEMTKKEFQQGLLHAQLRHEIEKAKGIN